MEDFDSDSELFITQSRFTSSCEVEINSEFEDLVNSNVGCNEIDLPHFDLTDSEVLDLDDNFSGSDSELCELSQKVEDAIARNTESNESVDNTKQPSTVSECSANSTSHRFGKPMSDSDIDNLCNSAFSHNTESKSKWAVKVFEAWVKERQSGGTCNDVVLNTDLVALAQNESALNKTLMRFLTEVRNRKGEEYRGNTLYELVTSLQYYLRRQYVEINFFDSPYFKGLRNVLDARMKALARQGIGIDKRQAGVISADQEQTLWDKGVLGEDTPEKLLDTLVYLIGLNMALRAGDEHRNLRVGPQSQLQVIEDSNGVKYLKYTEDTSKTNKGGLKSRKCEKKSIRVSENVEQPQRCLVRLYHKYMSLRPKNGKCNAFYLRPLRYAQDNVWYADVPVGKHPLRSTVSKLCKKVGFQGFFSNHSLRATAATRLYDSGLDEQLIAERTGHRSLAIRSYKRTSSEMENRVDCVIQRKSLKSGPSRSETATESSLISGPCATMTTDTAVTSVASLNQVAAQTTQATSKKELKVVLPDGAALSLSF